MLRLAHVADIHPNSNATFAGKVAIDPDTGKNLALTDLRKSLDFVFNTVRDLNCDAVLIPGDVFDTVKPTMDEVAVIVEWIELVAEEANVLVIPGNHDMAISPNMATALEPLRWRNNIDVMFRPGSICWQIHDDCFVRLFGLPYPSKAQLLTALGTEGKSPEEITAIINHGLASILRGFKAQFDSGDDLRLLLAHGSVAQCTVGDQPRSLAHDILIPLDELHGFDYCALGHIHQQQQVAPNAWYSGSLMRNGFGEENEPKGFNLVELERGQPPQVTFIENPHARVYTTFGYSDYLTFMDEGGRGLNKDCVWRFKATLTPEQYQGCKPVLEQWQQDTPFFQMDVELVQEDRSRDAGMAKCLTMDQALQRILTNHSEHETIALMEKHRALVDEVAA